MNDERRHAYRRQHVAHINLGVHLRERDGSARARAHAQVSSPPVAELWIVSNTRRAFVNPDWPTPLLPHHFEKLFALFRCRTPRILCVANSFRVSADHYEREGFFRIGGSEEAAHWTTFGNTAQCCAFGT